jgi:hypothetical protein
MNQSFLKYSDLIQWIHDRYNKKVDVHNISAALHDIFYDDVTQSFTYKCIDADESFYQLFQTDKTSLATLLYENIFLETKENRFNWGALIGHIGKFGSISSFYAYSQSSNKWYSIMAISPEQGKTLLLFYDITEEKNIEIAKNIQRNSATTA